MNLWTFLLVLALSIPMGIVIALLIAAFVYLHPDQSKKWGAIFGNAIVYLYEKFDYLTIKWETEGRINIFVRELESNIIKTFPSVHLQWVTSQDNEEIIWEEGKAILLMRDRRHKGRNFVHAAYLFTSQALLQNTIFHISKKQRDSLELFATKKILGEIYPGAVAQFMSDYFAPQVQSDPALKEFIAKYVAIEKIGAFFPILIQEVHCLGSKVFLEEIPKEETINEVNALLNFLVEFSDRRIGDTRVPDTFMGQFTRCAIRIIASKEVRNRGEIEGHKSELITLVDRLMENIYILGSGHSQNIDFVDRVMKASLEEKSELELRKTYKFKGKIKVRDENQKDRWVNTDTYLVHLHNPNVEEYLFTNERLSGVV